MVTLFCRSKSEREIAIYEYSALISLSLSLSLLVLATAGKLDRTFPSTTFPSYLHWVESAWMSEETECEITIKVEATNMQNKK